MDRNFMMLIPGVEPEEMMFLNSYTQDLSENQFKSFLMVYNGKRKDAQTILICTLVGVLGFAGIQRFLINQIGMGILYLLTGGLCLIGTIIDAVNHKKLTNEFNQKMAMESVQMAKMMG
ncbi:MAG: TM2 domain-containing protein [Bacteroidetes bacterium]|nr:TM2 domain-containing protein [Bacteroidota bacterium]